MYTVLVSVGYTHILYCMPYIHESFHLHGKSYLNLDIRVETRRILMSSHAVANSAEQRFVMLCLRQFCEAPVNIFLRKDLGLKLGGLGST